MHWFLYRHPWVKVSRCSHGRVLSPVLRCRFWEHHGGGQLCVWLCKNHKESKGGKWEDSHVFSCFLFLKYFEKDVYIWEIAWGGMKLFLLLTLQVCHDSWWDHNSIITIAFHKVSPRGSHDIAGSTSRTYHINVSQVRSWFLATCPWMNQGQSCSREGEDHVGYSDPQ